MTIKFYYFPLQARGEAIRMILAHSKTEFEDVRIQMGEWPKMKTENGDWFEFGQMPMLDMGNGMKMTQSKAIVRALGQKHGYYSSNPKEAWTIDSTMDYVSDNVEIFVKPAFADGEAKLALLFELLTKQLPQFLSKIEKRVSGKKWIIGDRITIADFMLGGLLTSTVANEGNPNYYAMAHIVKSYPGVCTYIENFKAEMKDYLASRPVSPF